MKVLTGRKLVLCLLIGLCLGAGLAFAQTVPGVENRPPEGQGQTPAFPGQTRAPQEKKQQEFKITVVAQGLDQPWAVAPLPAGGWLVTEKKGNLRYVSPGGKVSGPIPGMLPVFSQGQAGLLDLVLDPQFSVNRRLWWSFVEQRETGVGISVGQAEWAGDEAKGWRLDKAQVFFRTQPSLPAGNNYGSRLAFSPDGGLFLSVGDRFQYRNQAQQVESHIGKILKIAPGPVEIWSLGHRNIQGLAFDSNGRLWSVEHGARGGDELNKPEKGLNYGWPVISYGVEYSGQKIGNGLTQKAGLEQPVYYWDPVIAPSGLLVYTGKRFSAWNKDFFVGGLRGQHLARLTVKDGKVVGEERLLTSLGQRIRDVRQDLDGALLVLTDSRQGQLLRLE